MNRSAKVFLFYAISCDFTAIKSYTLWLIKPTGMLSVPYIAHEKSPQKYTY